MSSTKPNTLTLDSTPKLSVSLVHEPRLHLEAWIKAILKYARKLYPTLDACGSLFLVCPDDKWNVMSTPAFIQHVLGLRWEICVAPPCQHQLPERTPVFIFAWRQGLKISARVADDSTVGLGTTLVCNVTV
jgi:hypothetical protein